MDKRLPLPPDLPLSQMGDCSAEASNIDSERIPRCLLRGLASELQKQPPTFHGSSLYLLKGASNPDQRLPHKKEAGNPVVYLKFEGFRFGCGVLSCWPLVKIFCRLDNNYHLISSDFSQMELSRFQEAILQTTPAPLYKNSQVKTSGFSAAWGRDLILSP